MVNKIRRIKLRVLNYLARKSRAIFIIMILVLAFFGLGCAITALLLKYGLTIGTIMNIILALSGIILIIKLVIQWRKILFRDI